MSAPQRPLTPTLLDLFHFHESLVAITSGLADINRGLRDFEAGVHNLRVLFHQMEHLAYADLEREEILARYDCEGERIVHADGLHVDREEGPFNQE
jgi:hypothetical protein